MLAAGSDSQKISKSLFHTKYAVWMCAVVRGAAVADGAQGRRIEQPKRSPLDSKSSNRSHRSTDDASILMCEPPAPKPASCSERCATHAPRGTTLINRDLSFDRHRITPVTTTALGRVYGVVQMSTS